MAHITVDCCTKDRYLTTLPQTLLSIAMQTRTPDALVLYDDSENQMDIRNNETFRYILQLFEEKKIQWQVMFGAKRGQHIGHQRIQEMAQGEFIWRIDDDEIAQPNVLETLLNRFKELGEGVGAVGGLVLVPGASIQSPTPNKITDSIDHNCQWHRWPAEMSTPYLEVEHLYSSYLYRKGIQDFDINLSPVAHREETLHSYGIFKKGCKVIATGEAITYHFRSSSGGIRTGKSEDWYHDEVAFQETLREYNGKKVCFLDCGKGDHVIFKTLLPKIKEKYKEITLAVCYPDIFPDEKCISIAEGLKICNPEKHNIYKWCIDHNWRDELKYAYAEMYGVEI